MMRKKRSWVNPERSKSKAREWYQGTYHAEENQWIGDRELDRIEECLKIDNTSRAMQHVGPDQQGNGCMGKTQVKNVQVSEFGLHSGWHWFCHGHVSSCYLWTWPQAETQGGARLIIDEGEDKRTIKPGGARE